MKSTKNFFSFFLSRFYDSIKFNQSFAFRLKIYFERSTKYRQTIDTLGNVYRNSKWTDLKIQNIKGSHLFKFIRINILLSMLFILIYLILFRYNATFFYSMTSELNYFWLLISDFMGYLALATFSIFLNLYLMLVTLYYYLFNNITKLFGIKTNISDTNLSSYNDNSNLILNSIDYNNVKEYNLNFKSEVLTHVNNETFAISTLFKLKKILDFSNYSALNFSKNTNIESADNIVTSLVTSSSSKSSESFNLGKNLTSLESSFISSNFSKNFSKNKYSDSSIKQASKDIFVSSIIEDSSRLSFDKASSNRWILKMLPFSENLAINSSYFSKLKENVGNPFLESKITNRNIWIGNLQFNNLYDTNINDSLAKNPIDNFELSRLWNQKRNYFTLISKFSESKPLYSYRVDALPSSDNQDSSFIIGLINLDYQTYKNILSFNSSEVVKTNVESTKYSNFIYLSGSNLNTWNHLDKTYLNSLCSSDTSINNQQLNYIFLNYDHNCYKYL